MKTIQIGNEQYTLEFGFEAAENKSVVQRMFNALSHVLYREKVRFGWRK